MFVKKQFKSLIDRNRWFKSVPNALTLCNSICGFGAILYTLRAYSSPQGVTDVFAVSAWIIIFAMFFDAMDGFAARIFNAASMKGIQMDSLADMVTFGVAPATLVAIMSYCLQAMSQTQYLLICGTGGGLSRRSGAASGDLQCPMRCLKRKAVKNSPVCRHQGLPRQFAV